MRISPLLVGFGLFVACGCPKQQAATAGETSSAVASTASSSPAPTPSASAAASATNAPEPAVVAPVLAGLAAKVCPQGDPGAPPSGALSAVPLAGTEPTALDPKGDTGFHLYEGAVWFNGALYFSDFKTTPGFPSRILRFAEGGLSVALADSGTNGLGLDAAGERLVGARHKSKSVVVFDPDLKGQRDVASKHEGKPFNSPNDVVFRSDGNLYFTDPDFQAGARKDQATTNVYRVNQAGEVSAIDTGINNPNGISLSLDERTLYVAGNGGQGYVKRYPVAADGSVGAGQIFVQPVVVPDGMTLDCAGNLYVTEHTSRRVRVFSPDGKEIAGIAGMDKNVTNVAFGGPERKTLFITTTGGLYQLELAIAGLPY